MQINEFSTQIELTEEMIPILGKLYRNNNVVAELFAQQLVNKSVIDITKAHRFAQKHLEQNITVEDSLLILKEISNLGVGPCKIDLGRLQNKFQNSNKKLKEFLEEELKDVLGENKKELLETPQDIVLFGFGRIGRLLARILVEKIGGGQKMVLKAIVVRSTKVKDDIEKRAALLRRDSVHGQFQGSISVDNENKKMKINGIEVKIIYSDQPDQIDYTSYGIDNAILIDNTGIFRDRKGLSTHLKNKGISKVLLTAPGKDVPNIVAGVNYDDIKKDETIFSCASCTTNAIVPILKVINEKYSIEHAHLETVHSFTSDQNLLDNFHSKSRRGRSAPLNLVITETGASEAVTAILPELKGKLTGNSIRVPTPDVSLAMLILSTKNEKDTKKDVNEFLRNISLNSRQIQYSASNEVVSTDFVGNRSAGIVDSPSTIVKGSHMNLYVWYDNEFGYSCQVVRVLQKLSGIEHPRFPK
eukprot:gene4657-8230_t